MSAAVCGKRSLFEDLHGSPPIAKRIRCGGSSPIRFQSVVSPLRIGTAVVSEVGSPGRPSLSYTEDHLSQLRLLYPEMEAQLVERVLENCGKNIESAIKSLNDLRLSSSEQISRSSENAVHRADVFGPVSHHHQPVTSNQGYMQPVANQGLPVESKPDTSSAPSSSTPVEGMEWVELLVNEMMSASDIADARLRATRALEAFEKTVATRTGAIAEILKKENAAMKEQLQGLSRDNHILKRAVTIQHERHLEHEERARELQAVKQLLSQHQEQLRMLELNNYALTLHLRKAQEGSSIPGRFHPDLF